MLSQTSNLMAAAHDRTWYGGRCVGLASGSCPLRSQSCFAHYHHIVAPTPRGDGDVVWVNATESGVFSTEAPSEALDAVKHIGKGVFGNVYCVTFRTARETPVIPHVLKVMIPGRCHQSNLVDWIREVDALAAVSGHPHLVTMIAAYSTEVPITCPEGDPLSYRIVMRNAGAPLDMVLRTMDETWRRKNLRSMLHQILQALAFMEEHGMVHRDVKPSNIMVCGDSSGLPLLRLGDLGMARSHGSALRTNLVTTMPFRAPELISRQIEGDTKSRTKTQSSTYGNEVDSWSVGILALNMVHEQLVRGPHATLDDVKRFYAQFADMASAFPSDNFEHTFGVQGYLERHGIEDGWIPQYAEFVSLLEALLEADPIKRPTPLQALSHPFFSDMPCILHRIPMPTLPSISYLAKAHESLRTARATLVEWILTRGTELCMNMVTTSHAVVLLDRFYATRAGVDHWPTELDAIAALNLASSVNDVDMVRISRYLVLPHADQYTFKDVCDHTVAMLVALGGRASCDHPALHGAESRQLFVDPEALLVPVNDTCKTPVMDHIDHMDCTTCTTCTI